MQSGCRFKNIWSVLAVAGTVGVASAALATGPVKGQDQKPTKAAPGVTNVDGVQAKLHTVQPVKGGIINKGPEDFSVPPLRGPGPANDLCVNAEVIALNSSTIGTTIGAASDADAAICNPGGSGLASASVWYRFTGNGNPARLSLCGATWDTYLRVMTGACGNFTTCIGFNDDFCGLQSQMEFPTGAGIEYYVYLSGFSTASGDFTLNLTDLGMPPPGPVNDECAGAIALTCNSSNVADNTTATVAFDDVWSCRFGGGVGFGSIWYTFTATDTSARLETCNSFFPADDSMIEVFAGTCGALASIGCSEDFCGLLSRLDLVGLTPGQVYYVQFSSYDVSDLGSYTLDISCPLPPGPINDDCANAIGLACNTVTVADNTDSTVAPDDFWSCRFGGGIGAGSIWYTFVAAETSARVQTCASFFPADDSMIEVFSGTCGAFTSIGCAEDTCNGLLSRLDLNGLTVGQTYYIQLSSYSPADNGAYDLEIVCPLPPIPPGDECSTAIAITVPGQVIGDTTLFNPDAGLPACGVGDASPSVWYSFAGNGNSFTATTCNGTFYDSAISIFTGPCAGLACVANNDDFCGLQTSVTFNTTAGQTYYIVVRGFGASAGAFVLDIIDNGPPQPVPNCTIAIPLGTLPATVAGDTSFASPDPATLPACGPTSGSPSVWYSMVGTGNSIIATTCTNTFYDSVLSIFTDNCLSPICVAFNDDSCGLQSRVVFPTVAGQTYFIVVSGFFGSAGAYELFVEEAPPPCEIIAPPGATLENEANCGLPTDTTNGGCNSVPNVYSTIDCGVPVYGTGAFDGATRDTDWYQFTLAADDTVTVTVSAEFAAAFGIVGDATGPIAFNPNYCSQITQINPFATTLNDCASVQVSASLTAGTYVIFVGPLFGDIIACGSPADDYVVEVTIGAGCPSGGCSADWDNNGMVNSNDISAFLTSWLADVMNATTFADFDNSGMTNSNDISAFLTAWLAQVGTPC